MIQMKRWQFILMIILVVALGGSVAFGGAFLYSQDYRLVRLDDYEQYSYLQNKYGKLEALNKVLDDNYYKELDDKKVMESLCKGMFSSTGDPYTVYMTKEEFEDVKINTTGKFQGIGVTLALNKDGNIVIVSPIKDTPAERAGLKAGDIITEVNGVKYDGDTLEAAVANMRGEVGTEVEITYIRKNKKQKVKLIRANIVIGSVFSEVIDNIGYIYISNFDEATGKDFKKELHSLEMKKVKGLILDLRNNGGGIVQSGVEVADELLDKGILAYTEGKTKERHFINTTLGKTYLPYVVLINGNTASTSEIVVAGIKDNKGGKVIGTTSFGKGVIQSVQELPEGDAIKLTVAQYFSPEGKEIHGKGITPDYVVDLKETDTVDKQLNKALEIIKAEYKKRLKK